MPTSRKTVVARAESSRQLAGRGNRCRKLSAISLPDAQPSVFKHLSKARINNLHLPPDAQPYTTMPWMVAEPVATLTATENARCFGIGEPDYCWL
jgi:hypothetical protein